MFESRCDARLVSRDEALESLVWLKILKRLGVRQMKMNHVGGWAACEWGYAALETHFGFGTRHFFHLIFPQPGARPTSSNISKQLFTGESTLEVQ